MTAATARADAPAGAPIESLLTFHKATAGGKRVYRNLEAAIQDVYIPRATAEQLGNPGQIVLAVHAAGTRPDSNRPAGG
jgi:hypothetical protein